MRDRWISPSVSGWPNSSPLYQSHALFRCVGRIEGVEVVEAAVGLPGFDIGRINADHAVLVEEVEDLGLEEDLERPCR